MKKRKNWRGWLGLIIGILIIITLVILSIAIFITDSKNKVSDARYLTSAQVAQVAYIALHTFPGGQNQIIIPIGSNRWEGIAMPTNATAYDVESTNWHQVRPWKGKDGPIVHKGEPKPYIPIQRNRNISEATFWIRGEGDATITIER